MGEWTQANRQRSTPPRWMVDQELQELREEVAWMRSRLSAPSQGLKGKGKGKGQAKPKPKGASQGAPPSASSHSGVLGGSRQATTRFETQRGTGHPDLDRNQVSKMPGIQLDQPRGLQILRDTLSQATGCLKQFQSTIAAGGQATRHRARQVFCRCRRGLPSSESVSVDPGSALLGGSFGVFCVGGVCGGVFQKSSHSDSSTEV